MIGNRSKVQQRTSSTFANNDHTLGIRRRKIKLSTSKATWTGRSWFVTSTWRQKHRDRQAQMEKRRINSIALLRDSRRNPYEMFWSNQPSSVVEYRHDLDRWTNIMRSVSREMSKQRTFTTIGFQKTTGDKKNESMPSGISTKKHLRIVCILGSVTRR